MSSGDIILNIIQLRSSLGAMGEDLFEFDECLVIGYRDPEYYAMLLCGDTFNWAHADAEYITEDNWSILLETIEDIRPLWTDSRLQFYETQKARQEACALAAREYIAAHPDRTDHEWYDEHGNYTQFSPPSYPESPSFQGVFCDLFAARVRGMRPQGAAYTFYPPETWPLFDACGPEREIGFGNPYRPGEYKREKT